MEITWFGRSCFWLRAGQLSVLTDPFDLPPAAARPDTAGAAALPPADIVTISDRGAKPSLAARAPYRLVDGPGEYEIKGVPITGVATSATTAPAAAAPAGAAGQTSGGTRWNFVYDVLLDGVVVCHLGRLAEPPTAQQVQEIGLPDVLLVPLGEPNGLAVQRAVQLASQLEAKLLVPMTLGGRDDRAALEAFCRELGADPSAVEPRLAVTPTSLPAQARVVVLAAQEAAWRRPEEARG